MADLVPTLLRPGETILNKYRVERFLGRGRFGEVHLVENVPMARYSALKVVVVKDPATQRAVVEAQAHSLCGHDHVVEIRSADVFDGSVLIEMEFVEGGSLGDRLQREFVPVLDAIAYVKSVLYALEHAHARGIVHRDVKPGNIMLAPRGAKLSDFGTVIHPGSGIRVTDEFYRPHASPEAANDGEFSPASDVFAAGLTLLRAANNMSDEWERLLADPIAWRRAVADGVLPARIGYADWVPGGLRRVINKACARDPADRYPGAVAFRQALERLRPERRWLRLSADEWACDRDGRAETVRYVPGRRPGVEFRSGSRRVTDRCGQFDTEREARRWLGRVLAETTLAGSAPRRQVRRPRTPASDVFA
ncbi:serine/threonine-protein kinase [Bosea sp. TND4EK4]|uniref:serine/threonine-protein kinase n=1 Tax=Bosea sp. TND4EK4 TaxID=1907408 RepID=UPI0009572190|nr:serine/threonine-protein kinase [Bosea sp. TND4EK4]SIR28238.1 Serine/threonine protein kinase [Bosea sp. TND4EK4]